ncbi:hypothetical protein V6N13_036453 [Hibiscus sabdariffa]
MVTTPRLGLEREREAGLRESGRSLNPEKSPATLPTAGKEERKLVEREARREVDGEDVKVLLGLAIRAVVGGDSMCAWTAKLDAAAVATSIDGCDQHVLAVRYSSVIFFYPSDNASFDTSQKSRSLENSLSQILLHFYPLVGQLTDAVTIECNDEGACFVKAKSRCRLKELLANPDPELLKDLVPSTDPKAIRSTFACILLVQLALHAVEWLLPSPSLKNLETLHLLYLRP